MNKTLLLGCSIFAMGVAVPSAQAGTGPDRTTNSHAAANCSPATATADAEVRKRPLGVVNEGTAPVFVTCSFAVSGDLTDVDLFASSTLSAESTLECTGVSGGLSAPTQFIADSATLPGNDAVRAITFDSEDFSSSPTQFPNAGLFSVSCKLLPGQRLIRFQVRSTDFA